MCVLCVDRCVQALMDQQMHIDHVYGCIHVCIWMDGYVSMYVQISILYRYACVNGQIGIFIYEQVINGQMSVFIYVYMGLQMDIWMVDYVYMYRYIYIWLVSGNMNVCMHVQMKAPMYDMHICINACLNAQIYQWMNR